MQDLDRPRPSPPPAQPEEAEEGLVVAILALAATVATVLGARAAVVSSAASDTWQTAVREEVKRSPALAR